MQGLKEYIYTTLSSDTTIKGYVGANVFAGGVDLIEAYPCITIEEMSETDEWAPFNVRNVEVTITAWSESSNLEADEIFERIRTIFNMNQGGTTPLSELIHKAHLEGAHEHYDTERRLWRKAADIRFWVK